MYRRFIGLQEVNRFTGGLYVYRRSIGLQDLFIGLQEVYRPTGGI